ncbi:hypothetical protein [Thermoanaerobacter mathranii]|uniref:hypothetical protein n=1 Tax=Thermoanaerobacter mathranii TaxID=583357 RepID=UPI003D6B5B27
MDPLYTFFTIPWERLFTIFSIDITYFLLFIGFLIFSYFFNRFVVFLYYSLGLGLTVTGIIASMWYSIKKTTPTPEHYNAWLVVMLIISGIIFALAYYVDISLKKEKERKANQFNPAQNYPVQNNYAAGYQNYYNPYYSYPQQQQPVYYQVNQISPAESPEPPKRRAGFEYPNTTKYNKERKGGEK